MKNNHITELTICMAIIGVAILIYESAVGSTTANWQQSVPQQDQVLISAKKSENFTVHTDNSENSSIPRIQIENSLSVMPR